MSYHRVNWENYPSPITPINATNLNIMDKGIKDLDDAMDADATALANEVITRASLGAHNLLPNTAKTTTVNGVTFTVNTDGTVTASTGAGTASSSAYLYLPNTVDLDLIDGQQYILSGLSSNGSSSTFDIGIGNYGNSGSGKELTFTYNKNVNGQVFFRVYNGASVNVTFSPMIRLATDADDTYQPYAKTNKQLTDNVTDIETAIAPVEIGTASQTYAKGDYLIMNDKLYKATTAIVSGATLTVGTNIVQTSVAEELELNNMQLELTGISTNKGIIEGVFTNVIPLFTRDLMKCSGVVKVPGANTFGFTVLRISSTMYYGFFHANDRVFTAISSSGTVTAYQIVGTAI